MSDGVVRCAHSNMRTGTDCASEASFFGLIDNRASMALCARHASGWSRRQRADNERFSVVHVPVVAS